MFDHLRRIGNELQERGLSDFLAPIDDRMQGLHLVVDPVWFEGLYWDFFSRGFPWDTTQHPWAFRKFTGWEIPWDDRPPNWSDHCRVSGFPEKAEPVWIRVILKNESLIHKEQLRDVPAQFENYPIVYEYRPRCRSYSTTLAAGCSVGGDNTIESGTLGGYLRDNERLYGTTCAHVVQGEEAPVFHPAQADSVSARQVGVVRHSEMPDPTPPGYSCNNRSMSSAGRVDLACVEMDNQIVPQANPRVGVVNDIDLVDVMCPRTPVVFAGKSTKYREAEIGALCIWHEIDVFGQPHCFGDVFEITHRKPYYVNTSLARPGDSGAWTVSVVGSCVSWNGMLIGGDGAQAYCSFAENVLESVRSELGNPVLCLDSTVPSP